MNQLYIYINFNRLNAPTKDIWWLIGLKKFKKPFNMLFTRDSLQGERHTQTESDRMEKDISCKQKQPESGGSNIHIRQKTLKQRL